MLLRPLISNVLSLREAVTKLWINSPEMDCESEQTVLNLRSQHLMCRAFLSLHPDLWVMITVTQISPS